MNGVRLQRCAHRAAMVLGANGVDIRRVASSIVGLTRYLRDLRRYRRLERGQAHFPARLLDLFPCCCDFGGAAGATRGHYFRQDLLVARKIFERRPSRHVDIGSRIDGFVAHLLCFMPVEVVDIRPLTNTIPGLTFIRSDASDLADIASNSVPSLSSLHAAEHFGLGRYGDPLDPDGAFRFMRSLARILAVGGRLYFSVPVGRERLEFNAHRVFAPSTICANFANLTLVSFDCVHDDGELERNAGLRAVGDADFACGIFEFTKPSAQASAAR